MKTFYFSTMMNLAELINTGLQVMNEDPTAIGFEFSSGLPKNDYGSTYRVFGSEDIAIYERYVPRGVSKEIPKGGRIEAVVSNHVADVLVANNMDVQTQIISGVMVFIRDNKLTVMITLQTWSPPTARDIFNMARIGN